MIAKQMLASFVEKLFVFVFVGVELCAFFMLALSAGISVFYGEFETSSLIFVMLVPFAPFLFLFGCLWDADLFHNIFLPLFSVTFVYWVIEVFVLTPLFKSSKNWFVMAKTITAFSICMFAVLVSLLILDQTGLDNLYFYKRSDVPKPDYSEWGLDKHGTLFSIIVFVLTSLSVGLICGLTHPDRDKA